MHAADAADAVVRPVYGAGQWYPGEPDELAQTVETYIAQAKVSAGRGRPLAVLAPHAGYLYSGGVAGYTYRALRDAAARGEAPELVVVLGFGHRAGFPGTALLDGDAIELPTGRIPIDQAALTALRRDDGLIHTDATPHMGEHSAENQLPFLHAALPGTPVVVGLMGDHAAPTIAALVQGLQQLATTRRLLVIASTDLLHDADYDKVTRTDRETLATIVALQDAALAEAWSPHHQVCCGIGPVLTAMRFAAGVGCQAGALLHYRNSGDDWPASRGEWVVGYGAVLFSAAES
jgi:AmmeMemoRadiSam system protein B